MDALLLLVVEDALDPTVVLTSFQLATWSYSSVQLAIGFRMSICIQQCGVYNLDSMSALHISGGIAHVYMALVN